MTREACEICDAWFSDEEPEYTDGLCYDCWVNEQNQQLNEEMNKEDS